MQKLACWDLALLDGSPNKPLKPAAGLSSPSEVFRFPFDHKNPPIKLQYDLLEKNMNILWSYSETGQLANHEIVQLTWEQKDVGLRPRFTRKASARFPYRQAQVGLDHTLDGSFVLFDRPFYGFFLWNWRDDPDGIKIQEFAQPEVNPLFSASHILKRYEFMQDGSRDTIPRIMAIPAETLLAERRDHRFFAIQENTSMMEAVELPPNEIFRGDFVPYLASLRLRPKSRLHTPR
ncbi:hypothetical protein DL93DRAFT_1295860 [Clavulina sp. PMI_390]|nr:hypothetical protein DL93DRAFT_1295860 [Clavulina sp. PMI_390]